MGEPGTVCPVRLDGRLDEAVWDEVAGHDEMVLVDPDTLEPARHSTVVRFLYTDEGLYVGVWNEQPRGTLQPRLPREDAGAYRDGWGITLDTSGEGQFGSWFNVDLRRPDSPAGAPPGDGEAEWTSATVELGDGWSLEAFLPWSRVSLPRVRGERLMGMYTHRRVAYLNERWGWPAVLTPGRGPVTSRGRTTGSPR